MKLFSAILITAMTGLVFPVMTQAQYACEIDLLEVLFSPDYQIRLRQDQLRAESRSVSPEFTHTIKRMGSVSWQRLAGQTTEAQLDSYHVQAERQLQHPVYNMNNIFYLRLHDEQDVWEITETLKQMPEVINAYPVPLPMPLPTPNWQDDQEYLNNTADWPPTGFNSYAAWEKVGGTGTGVTICDFEYSWNTNHVDLTKAVNSEKNPYAQDPYSDNNHGTAVLGELIASDNGWGVTGMVYDADVIAYGTYYDPTPPHTSPDWRLPEAMIESMAYLKAGDVMLLEQQWRYTTTLEDFIPVEWWGSHAPSNQTFNSVYAGIVTAIGNGIHVVEAGGNGGVDLDSLTWYGDSGAIVVGAGGAYSGGFYTQGDLFPLDFTCYGSRVNVQGWGEDVATTGYGSYTGSTGVNDMFCWDFAGTSSASPMVAACVASCVGYWTQYQYQTADSLSPADLRSILTYTGTPQDTMTLKQIGPRPDLSAAFKALDARVPAYFYEVDLQMPSTFYSANDPFYLNAIVNNPGPPGGFAPLVILLEVQGSFWFYPTWSTDFTYENYELVHGAYAVNVIPAFNWPSGTGTLNGINVYGALLTTDFSEIWGLWDMETFGFSS